MRIDIVQRTAIPRSTVAGSLVEALNVEQPYSDNFNVKPIIKIIIAQHIC